MITVRSDERFRATAAVLLLTPYIEYQKEVRPHPLRAPVLSCIEPHREHPCAVLFRELVQDNWFGAQFYSLAAWLTPTPPFRWQTKFAQIGERCLPPSYVKRFEQDGLGQTYPAFLAQFYEAARLASVWTELQPQWEQVCAEVREALETSDAAGWLHSFWGPAPKRLHLLPNPTDPATFGFAASNEEDAFCLMGANSVPWSVSEEEAREQFDYRRGDSVTLLAVHEFGHTYLDGAREEIARIARDTAAVGQGLTLKDWFPKMYPAWETQLHEIILQAVEGVRLSECVSRASGESHMAGQVERFGLEILPAIYEELLESRAAGLTVGPMGCARALERALARYETR
ncbi:MAG: DUF4932 domain-containing protein [Armatimonadetes bacterium]|nr:DUF4932 domain-containing protein [Armatimonadota bacterium]